MLCVDYRRTSNLTLKNTYPLHMVNGGLQLTICRSCRANPINHLQTAIFPRAMKQLSQTVKSFAQLGKPLNYLIKKGTVFIQTEKHHFAFTKLKEKLPHCTFVAISEFILNKDTSNSVKAVQSQAQWGEERVLSYACYQQRFCVTQCECCCLFPFGLPMAISPGLFSLNALKDSQLAVLKSQGNGRSNHFSRILQSGAQLYTSK